MILPDISTIVCLEADINYTIFHLANGKKIVSSYTLKRFVEQPEFSLFLRINRGSLVNPTSIQGVEKQGNTAALKLSNGEVRRVSRRRLGVLDVVA